MMRRREALAAGLLLALAAPAAVSAQQRPFLTEDPESVGGGVLLLEAGFDYQRNREFPASGLTGNLVRIPQVGVSIGLSDIAELQIDGLSFDRLGLTSRVPAPLSRLLEIDDRATSSVSDLVLGTKVRLIDEGRFAPAFGLRLATKLPNASNEDGLGLDTIDFYASLLAGKTIDTVRVVANGGFGILSDPTTGNRQNDVLTYGLSIARAMTGAAEVVAEVSGRLHTRRGTPPPGTESASEARLGARVTVGAMRIDGALVVGLTPRDPDVGMTAGFTWAFRAFSLP